MKTLIALLTVFVLMGCQTTDELSKNMLPKKEVIPMVEKIDEYLTSAPVIPDLFNSQKPVLCGKAEVILSRITNKAKEMPIIFWKSEPFGFPAALYINRITGTSTVLDFLSPKQVCMVSVGTNLKLSKEFKPTKGMSIRYLTN